MRLFRDRRPVNPKEVDRIGEEIEELNKNKDKHTKLEFLEKQLLLFREINKYQLPKDISKEVKKGIKVAKVGIAIYKETAKITGKVVQKTQKIKKKFKVLK